MGLGEPPRVPSWPELEVPGGEPLVCHQAWMAFIGLDYHDPPGWAERPPPPLPDGDPSPLLHCAQAKLARDYYDQPTWGDEDASWGDALVTWGGVRLAPPVVWADPDASWGDQEATWAGGRDDPVPAMRGRLTCQQARIAARLRHPGMPAWWDDPVAPYDSLGFDWEGKAREHPVPERTKSTSDLRISPGRVT
jgi:hypothetical protein